jgi:cell division protease FtsH
MGVKLGLGAGSFAIRPLSETRLNNQWFSKIAVWLVIALVLFTVFKQFDTRGAAGAQVVGYSDFLEQVRNKQIKQAIIQ